MAVDVFLKVKGIEGESADSKHPNEIDVLSYSWGVSQTGTASYGGGMGAGKANFGDFNFMMRMNKATP
ncbi:MAG TPA: type VI secretion system tube protein Hcp, partial [Bryobacteraceae bacterium]|nr:type VI secretion system tube protein Hcp [Bryobacteraceae bacterium]